MATLDVWEQTEGDLRWDNGLTTGVMTANEYSMLIPVRGDRMSIQIAHPTGDIVGAYKFRGVNTRYDVNPVALQDEGGNDILFLKTTGNSLNALVELNNLTCRYVQVFFDFTSGTTGPGGTAIVHQKG